MIPPRLPKAQCEDSEEHLPTAPCTRHYQSDFRLQGQILYKIGCMLGIQQCTSQEGRQVESHLPNKSGPLWTSGHILWPHQLSSHLPNHDEWHLQRPHQWRLCGDLHGWYPGIHLHDWTPLGGHDLSPGHTPKHLLYLKAEKCAFECTMVEYLGLVLSEGHMEMDPVKYDHWGQGLANPKECHQGSVLHGLCELHHRFIPKFSHVASPLHCLTKKAEPWWWTELEETAFWLLKSFFMLAPILILPDQDGHFWLETDTSRYATGAILSQLHDDEKWHPISFTSKSRSPAKCNYAIYDKEFKLLSDMWTGGVEAHTGRDSTHDQNPEWPLKPHVFPNGPDTELSSGPVVHWSLYLSWFDYSPPIELADIQPSQMPYPDVSTTNLREMTTRIRSCSQQRDLHPNLLTCHPNT